LVGQDFKSGDGGSILWDDVLAVPRATGELEEVVAGILGAVHGRQ